jgi:hypothetical protein
MTHQFNQKSLQMHVIRRSGLPFEEKIVWGTRQVRMQLEPRLDLTRHI